MVLRIETFNNATGGNALYKALTHPSATRPAQGLVQALADNPPVAVCDPGGGAEAFAELFPLNGIEIAGVYVQQIDRLDHRILGYAVAPVTELGRSGARSLFVSAFDASRLIAQLQPFLPAHILILSLDRMRIPADRLTNHSHYLDPLNFATNFAFFRDTDQLHTRLTTANYWTSYGGHNSALWLTLFGDDGEVLAEWCESCGPPGASIVLDSREIRARFRLPEFCGQLFLHVVGVAGHDIVKYALDIFADERGDGADRSLSTTHDANAWPSDRYAGLPAPAPGEKVVLWIQNSHPVPIPAGAIGLNRMGEDSVVSVREPIAPFATRPVDVAALLPGVSWPAQLELGAGKHMVRPRYEIVERDRRRIAHVNVERADLLPNPKLPRLAEWLGKGYLLPAPVLPRTQWRTLVLPTPMATCQAELPVAAIIYDPDGNEISCRRLGNLPRGHASYFDLDDASGIDFLDETYGHLELVYDFAEGGQVDGWLHAIFRYQRRDRSHAAETSFGAHIFNTLLTYRDEPQSYNGRPPGLSTRLFLRLGEGGYDTLCHLIYSASRPWKPHSETDIILYDGAGKEIARRSLSIPCSGSRLWRYRALFDAATRARAGGRAYAIIRDTTCRLFGYHGLLRNDGAFSLDHMFGF
jgi:hypothetical protein